MSAATRKQAETGAAHLAAMSHFDQMAKLFASRRAKKPPYLSSTTLNDFRNAPRAELAVVRTVLDEILNQLNRVTPPEVSGENAQDGAR